MLSKMLLMHASFLRELPMKEVWMLLLILQEYILLECMIIRLKDIFKIRMEQRQYSF